ncbi:MAG: hypothetical protein WDN25_02295 [Acetobacteraceae bacterium]
MISRIVGTAMLLAVSVADANAQQAPAEECVAQAETALIFVRSNATQCGARAEDINSIDRGTPAIRYTQAQCAEPLRVNSQRSAFEECSRVYYCSRLALQCVKTTATRERRCDTQISVQCMQQYPIPQQ